VNGNLVPDVAFLNDTLSLATELEITYELMASLEGDVGIARTIQNDTSDLSLDTELALLWLMNEYARLRSFWQFSLLGSDDASRRFDKHRIGVVLTLHY
jgi:hypothetical protein